MTTNPADFVRNAVAADPNVGAAFRRAVATRYAVRCQRLASSEFGAAECFYGHEGQAATFDRREDAEEIAAWLTARAAGRAYRFEVVEVTP